jgi:hypothetical protein
LTGTAKQFKIEQQVARLEGSHLGAAAAAHGCEDGGESVPLVHVRSLVAAPLFQQLDQDASWDGKLEESWAAHGYRAGVKPATVFAWCVQGGQQSCLPVALGYGSPNAL